MSDMKEKRPRMQENDRVARDGSAYWTGLTLPTFGTVKCVRDDGTVLVVFDHGPGIWVRGDRLERVESVSTMTEPPS